MFAPMLLLTVVSAAPAEKPSNRALYDQTVRATVNVNPFRDGKVKPGGSGFVLDARRKWILTNFHVVSSGECRVTFPRFENGRVVSARKAYDLEKGIKGKVLDSDPRCDLSLIELDSMPEGVKELKFASEKPQPGDLLHLVGNPSASSGMWIYTTGRTRALVHKSAYYNAQQSIDADVIEAQMDCNAGDSGSPVVNDAGELVGVHSGSEKAAHVRGFAWHIDLDEVKTFRDDMLAFSDKTKLAPAAAYERRAERFRRKGDNAHAIDDYSKAIELDPSSGQSYRWRSRLYFLKGHRDAALMDAYRAVELLPKDGHVYNERANAFYARKDHRRAIADYSEAIRLLPKDAMLRVNRARAYFGRKDDDPALKDLAEAAKIAPTLSDPYQERGDYYANRRDYKQAIVEYRTGLAAMGNHGNLLARLGHALYHDGQTTHASEAYQLALKSGTTELGAVHRSLGVSRFQLRQFDLAVQSFAEAQKYETNNSALWYSRAAALEELGEVELAQGEYAKAAAMGNAQAKELKTFDTRALRIHNATQEDLKVYVAYETRTKDGNWVKTQPIEWTIQPGQPVYLQYNGVNIEVRSCRLWAVGAKSGKTWDNLKRRTLLLVETPYKARKLDAHTHRFGS